MTLVKFLAQLFMGLVAVLGLLFGLMLAGSDQAVPALAAFYVSIWAVQKGHGATFGPGPGGGNMPDGAEVATSSVATQQPTCLHCHAVLPPPKYRNAKKEFCNGRCRVRYWEDQRENAVRQAAAAVQEAKAAVADARANLEQSEARLDGAMALLEKVQRKGPRRTRKRGENVGSEQGRTAEHVQGNEAGNVFSPGFVEGSSEDVR